MVMKEFSFATIVITSICKQRKSRGFASCIRARAKGAALNAPIKENVMYTKQTQKELDNIEKMMSKLLDRTEKARALDEPYSAILWERIYIARNLIRDTDIAVWDSMN